MVFSTYEVEWDIGKTRFERDHLEVSTHQDRACWVLHTTQTMMSGQRDGRMDDECRELWTEHPHSAFFSHICTLSSLCTHHIVAQGVARRVCIEHVHSHVITCLSAFVVRERRALNPKRTRKKGEYCFVAIFNTLTGCEPNQLDNFDYSEASAAILQAESVDVDTELSYSCDAELDDELIGKALSSPLFIQEREEPANLRQTYHSRQESLLPAQSFFHTHKYGETRKRTKFRFVSRTEIKSRLRKRANQDSP